MSNQSEEHEAGQNNYTVGNDNLTVAVTKNPHCQTKLEIKVQPHATKAAYLKAMKNVNKEVSVPGFRKGRAPEKFIQEKYGSVIQKEFVDVALQTAFNEALHLANLHPLRDGKQKSPIVHECSQEKGAHFTLEIETRPSLPEINLDGLQIKKIVPETITEKSKEEAFQTFLMKFITFEPVEDRPVEKGDYIDLSLTILEDPPREAVKNQRVKVDAPWIPDWFFPLLVGHNKNDQIEGMTEQDPESPNTEEFISHPFQAVIHGIWKGILPPVDDELAKRVGLSTVEELRNKINERTEDEAKNRAYQQEIRSIEKLLVDTYPIDLPQSYIEYHKRAQMDRFFDDIANQEITEEQISEITTAIENNAIYELQLYLLLHKIGSDYEVKPTESDISQEVGHQLSLIRAGHSSFDLKEFTEGNKELYKKIHDAAFDRKIREFLVERIKKID